MWGWVAAVSTKIKNNPIKTCLGVAALAAGVAAYAYGTAAVASYAAAAFNYARNSPICISVGTLAVTGAGLKLLGYELKLKSQNKKNLGEFMLILILNALSLYPLISFNTNL